MMSPFSGWVLVGAAVASSPAWHAALVAGTMSVETAAARGGIALLVVWIGLSLLGSLVQGTSPASVTADDTPHSPPAADRSSSARPAGVEPPGSS